MEAQRAEGIHPSLTMKHLGAVEASWVYSGLCEGSKDGRAMVRRRRAVPWCKQHPGILCPVPKHHMGLFKNSDLQALVREELFLPSASPESSFHHLLCQALPEDHAPAGCSSAPCPNKPCLLQSGHSCSEVQQLHLVVQGRSRAGVRWAGLCSCFSVWWLPGPWLAPQTMALGDEEVHGLWQSPL